MKSALIQIAGLLACAVSALPSTRDVGATEPFLAQVDNSTWVIGNDVWNMTQGRQYGVKLWYKGRDCVGSAVGHYVSYNGAASDLNWTSASIVGRGTAEGKPFIDVKFTALEGDMHWVIVTGLAGAYQYFVNRALPPLGEFRTLWRLDNATFTRGRTDLRDEALPPLADYVAANKVQDETWRRPDGKGGFITKYDLSGWVRTQTAYGVYGSGFGSWYIHAGKDYFNGNHLKQELMVHRESRTGDTVQLNMIHGTHFQASSTDVFPDGKMWGPWLWYLNDGSKADVDARSKAELAAWPYKWLDEEAYQSRGSVRGKLVLSDGRPATNAAVFLGDNKPNKTALDMGTTYYYTTYADADGTFEFPHVRAAVYGLQAWSNGSAIGDVSTTFLQDGVSVARGQATDLGRLSWPVSTKKRLFQIGDFDRTAYGFQLGGAPYTHALVERCPENLAYRVGSSRVSDWCFGQTFRGNWTVQFRAGPRPDGVRNATLVVSLAAYSGGATSTVWANGVVVGSLTGGGGGSSARLTADPSLHRSATTAGEWRYFEFGFDAGVLVEGTNEVRFELTRNSSLGGFMWDAVALEW